MKEKDKWENREREEWKNHVPKMAPDRTANSDRELRSKNKFMGISNLEQETTRYSRNAR
jgi:hypothetical protein